MAVMHRTLIAVCAAALACAAPAAADPATPVPPPPAPPPPLPAGEVSFTGEASGEDGLTNQANEPPPAPEFIPPLSGIGNVLAQTGSDPGGLLGMPDLSAYGPNLLLGQNPAPAAVGVPATAPGTPPAPPAIPNLNVFNPEYLLAQNQTPAAPGGGEAAPGFGPDQDNPGTGRIAFLRRIYQMYGAGALKGALLGQQSPEEFADQPVAPPPPAG